MTEPTTVEYVLDRLNGPVDRWSVALVERVEKKERLALVGRAYDLERARAKRKAKNTRKPLRIQTKNWYHYYARLVLQGH